MRILYCRVGWTSKYNGYEKPEGGGEYNEKNTGLEAYNYADYDGRYYGFVEPGVYSKQPETHKSIHIEKILGNKTYTYSRKADSINNVLVVWVSTHPNFGGQYIIGWYENATVYRRVQTVPADVMAKRHLKNCI